MIYYNHRQSQQWLAKRLSGSFIIHCQNSRWALRGVDFYSFRKSAKGSDTDQIYNFAGLISNKQFMK